MEFIFKKWAKEETILYWNRKKFKYQSSRWGHLLNLQKKTTEAAVSSAWEILGFSLQDIDILAQGWLHKKDHCTWKPSPSKVSFILFPLNLSAPWPYVEFLELASQFQLSSSVVKSELQKDTTRHIRGCIPQLKLCWDPPWPAHSFQQGWADQVTLLFIISKVFCWEHVYFTSCGFE